MLMRSGPCFFKKCDHFLGLDPGYDTIPGHPCPDLFKKHHGSRCQFASRVGEGSRMNINAVPTLFSTGERTFSPTATAHMACSLE